VPCIDIGGFLFPMPILNPILKRASDLALGEAPPSAAASRSLADE
jgi:hypothetical protein